MAKHNHFIPQKSTVGDFGDDIQGLIDSGVTIAENAAAAVTEYANAAKASGASTGAPPPPQEATACAAQGGTWVAPGSPYYSPSASGPYCGFFPPEVVSGIDRCAKMGGIYDAHLGNCVPKSATTKPYSARDLECFNQGKVFNYLVNSCITMAESVALETENANLVCGKHSSLKQEGDFKSCRCDAGYDWADSGATLDCVAKPGAGGTSSGTVKQTSKTPPKAATTKAGGGSPETAGAKKSNWMLYAGIGGAAAVAAAVLYAMSKKKGAAKSGDKKAKSK